MTVITSQNPRLGEAVEDVQTATSPAEVADVVANAAAAAKPLDRMTPTARGNVLRSMADALAAQRQSLVDIADRESAIGPDRLNGELTRTIGQLQLFADVLADGHCFEVTIDQANADKTPPQPDLRRMLSSLGPVAVFGASNFPFAFSAAGGDTASALAAGSPVVIKVHSSHPRLDTEVAKILRNECIAAGLPAGTIGWVYGRDAGAALVQHPQIQAVGFTGSESAGRLMMDLAAGREKPIPVYAEMGSLNPLIISPGAVGAEHADDAATGVADSVTLAHGQLCTKPGLIFVPTGPDGDEFVTALFQNMSAKQPQYMLSTGSRDGYRANVQTVHQANGVRSLLAPDDPEGPGSQGAVALAEVSAGQLREDSSMLIECFGPATLILRYAGEDELSEAFRELPSSLTTTVHAHESEINLLRTVQDIGQQKSGRLLFNGFPTGVAVTWSQHHGGPYPASSTSMHTSVGATAIRRFQRPTTYQSWPNELLPPHLQAANPLSLPRRVDGVQVASEHTDRVPANG